MSTLQLTGGLVAGHIPNMTPMEQAVAGYFARFEKDPYKRDCRRHLEFFLTWCQANEIHDPLAITTMQLEMYLRWLQQQPWSESTIQSRFGAIAVFYKRAYRDRLIPWDPAVDIPRPKVDKTKQHRTWMTQLQMAKVLQVAKDTGPHEYALCVLMAECGLRVSEACSLQIGAITMQGGWKMVSFVGKGDKAAKIVLPMATMRAVEAAVGDRTAGPILLNTWGRPMNRSTAHRTVKRIVQNAGIDPTTVACHTFRRTAAKTAVDLGAPLQKVQQLLRHSDPKTTMDHYIGDQGFEAHVSHQIAARFDGLVA